VAAVSDWYLDIGGRSLHVVRSGDGSPAVILEAGSGCSAEHWRAVQELAGEFAATYSYDRAGHGSSDEGHLWTLDGWVADLEAWLSAARVSPPYLLVGHSLGGHIVRAFAARHRSDVVGLILVDARHEDLMPVLPESFRGRLAELVPYDFERGYESDEAVRNLPPLVKLPVSVIAHSRADWIHELFGLSQSELDQAEQAWQRYQLDLAAKFPESRFQVAANSGHMIPIDEPELVVSEIRSMIAAVVT
jgi:pimeloyl-ACP methyl ester carboxylesterase